MNKYPIPYPYLTVFLALALLLSGCQAGSLHFGRVIIGEVRIGFFGSNEPGEMTYSYSTFTGFENGSIQAGKGQIIEIEYDVKVNKGSLTIEIQDPDGEVVWEKTLEADGKETVEVTVQKNGVFAIVASGDRTGGSFEIKYAAR